ncbi:MAG: acetyl-CoA carboxylase biotin carboxylase subunit [Kiritimatiellia bacterium]
MFKKILIANRGEIAVRVIRACKELGIQTVAVYSEADESCLHVRLSDEAVCIGPAPSAASYLQIDAILDAARKTGAQAIHPGYGFLSEKAEFADACDKAKIVFIGPSAKAIRKLGDKVTARATMHRVGVPIPPGTRKPIRSRENVVRIAKDIGYPLLIKPSAGGGGKGMQIVSSPHALKEALELSQSESAAVFGSGDVYLEKVIEDARHIEIQIMADQHGNVIHLGERECSIQRRHQKLIEESPSVIVDEELRKRMGAAAVAAAKAVGYVGAGTVEFLLDRQKQFYFIEMNTRIQVEHPVTEWVTGIDLIRMQIRVAAGESLGVRQEDVVFKGHAIECRINAEDPDDDFSPSPGLVAGLILPGGPGVRIDTHLYNGYHVPHHYDSLLAKFIVHAENRELAIARMLRVLEEFQLENLKTTVPFLQRILKERTFRHGNYTTGFVEELRAADIRHRLHDFMHKLSDSFRRLTGGGASTF